MKTSKLILLLLILLTACGRLEIGFEQTATPPPTNTLEIPPETATVVPTSTVIVEPTATQTNPAPTNTVPPPTAVPPTAASTATPGDMSVMVILIALEDNGQSGTPIGCGDSAIPVTVTIPRTQGVLRAALEKLLSMKQEYYGESGLYNALHQSDLQLKSVTINQGTAVIHLTGNLVLGGVCDSPRVQAQIERTALQFSTVGAVDVFLNDIPLANALSQR